MDKLERMIICVASNYHKNSCVAWNGFYYTQKKDLTNPRNRAMVEMLLRVAFHVILGSGFFHVFFPLPFFSSFFFVSYLPMFQWLTLKTWKKLKKLLQTRAKWAIFLAAQGWALRASERCAMYKTPKQRRRDRQNDIMDVLTLLLAISFFAMLAFLIMIIFH